MRFACHGHHDGGSNYQAPKSVLTPPATTTYSRHRIGVLSAGLIITWQRPSSQARVAHIGKLPGRVTGLLAESGQRFLFIGHVL